MRFLALFIVCSALACSSRSSSEDSDESATGEATTNVSGDDADATEGSDPELEQLCLTGCERFALCAPDAYAAAYADDQACFDYCFTTFSSSPACREAAGPYAACTAALDCDQWPDLLADPATSACADEWSVAGPACGLT